MKQSLTAKDLRIVDEDEIKAKLASIKRNPIYFILEDVFDTYNIGGLFRLADALAIEKIYLCGGTETPPNSRILKASVGTYKVVPWEYKHAAKEAIDELRSLNTKYQIPNTKVNVIAIEQAQNSIDYREANYTAPVAFLVGNETSGVTEATLKLVDQVVEIPMWGINKSLNVIVSAAIVSYFAFSKSGTGS